MLTDEQIAFAWLDFGQAVGGTRPTTPTPYHFARALERIFIAAERERCSAEFVENGRAIGRLEEREACAKACESSELPIRCTEDAYANSFLMAAARKIRERSNVGAERRP